MKLKTTLPKGLVKPEKSDDELRAKVEQLTAAVEQMVELLQRIEARLNQEVA